MNARITHYLGHQTLLVAQIVFVLFFLQLFVVDVGTVNGVSMEPTMHDTDVFMVNRAGVFIHEFQRGDVIQFFHPLHDDTLVVKRVIGLPGETVEIRPGGIVITQTDGTKISLDEPYLSPATRTLIKPGWYDRFLVPDHSYVVLGDNREFSADSREYGVVHRRRIIGEVVGF